MPAYFPDTSSLVKQYVDEIGSEWIRRIIQPVPENTFYVSWTTGPEMVSAITRRKNRGYLQTEEA